ncbi:hypothetical protein NHX12_014721, partial [Muraenolepis orangiensis]
DGAPLNCNFVPLDIQLENWEDLPEAFSRRRENRVQVVCFVRDWVSLSAMKQRLLRRGASLYVDRQDVAQASRDKAQQDGGSTRLVTKESFFNKRRSASALSPPASKRRKEKASPRASVTGPPASDGPSPSSPSTADPSTSDPSVYLQALDSRGVPLCLHCQQPCPASPDAASTWDSRFCSHNLCQPSVAAVVESETKAPGETAL